MNSPGFEKKNPTPAMTRTRKNKQPDDTTVGAEPSESGSKPRGSVAKRRRNARQKAMQAIYQWDFDANGNSVTEIIQQFCELQNMERVDVDYFKEVFLFVAKNLEAVDASIGGYIDRPMERLDPVERSVLRVACAEFMCRLDIPYKVIVNEALEITKLFGADQGHRFVNGVVDKLAAEHRSMEYKPDTLSSDPT